MPKSRKRKKARARQAKVKNSESIDSQSVFQRLFTEDFDRDTFRDHLVAEAKKAKQELPIKLESLIAAIHSVEPLYFLSNVSWICITNFGEENYPSGWTPPLQSHVEFAQAICLSSSHNTEKKFSSPHHIQECLESLKEYFELVQTSRFSQLSEAKSEEDRAQLVLRERLRLHTELVRNWGYPEHVKSILRNIYSQLNNEFEKTIGLNADQLITLFDHLVSRIELGINDHMGRFGRSMRQKTKRKILEKYYDEFEIPKTEMDSFWNFVKNNRIGRTQFISMLLSHSGIFLTSKYIFDTEDISNSLNLKEEAVQKSLGYLSHSFGDLDTSNSWKYQLDNPIWSKPVIRIGSSKCFCPIPMIFFGQSIRLLDNLVKENFEGVLVLPSYDSLLSIPLHHTKIAVRSIGLNLRCGMSRYDFTSNHLAHNRG